jgi:hypothetical protein
MYVCVLYVVCVCADKTRLEQLEQMTLPNVKLLAVRVQKYKY